MTPSQVMENTKDKVKFFLKSQKWDWRGAALTLAVTPFVVQVWAIGATQARGCSTQGQRTPGRYAGSTQEAHGAFGKTAN